MDQILLADITEAGPNALQTYLGRLFDVRYIDHVSKLKPALSIQDAAQLRAAFIRIDHIRLDGVEATRQIKLLHPYTRVVWMAYSSDYALMAFEKGADAFLLLPATQQKVEAVMERLGYRMKYSPLQD